MCECTVYLIVRSMRDVSRLPRWSHSRRVHVGSLVYQLHGIWSLASPQSNRPYIICGIRLSYFLVFFYEQLPIYIESLA